MPPDLIATKLLIPPTRPEYVPRPRLADRLSHGAGRRLCLLAAPAGFGKTTLLSNWLPQSSWHPSWLTLDEQDNDPARFFAYLIEAVHRAGVAVSPQLVQAVQSPRPLPPDVVATALVNSIALAPVPFLLILDDYHAVTNDICHQAVDGLLQHAPPQLHLLIATREEPPLSLARLRVAGQLAELRAKELRFSPAESSRFVELVAQTALSTAGLQALQARTEGWVAGLQLAALSLRGKEPAEMERFLQSFGGSHRHVADYLTEEIMARQTDERRQFLVRTSILDRLTGPLCDVLTGTQGGGRMLDALYRDNLFVMPMDGQGTWYRYHPLFATYLQTELDERARQGLHLDAAGWLEQNGQPAEAVRHALASGDPDAAARLIGRVGYAEFQRGGLATLHRWLLALPEKQILDSAPLLALKVMTSFILTQSTEAERYLPVLEKRVPPDAPAVLRGRMLGMKAWVASRKGDQDAAIELGEAGASLLAEADPFAQSFVLIALGQAYEAQGHTTPAAQAYRRAWTAAQGAGSPLAAAVALFNLVLTLDSQGRRREAEALCLQMLGPAGDPDQGYATAEIMHLPLGVLHFRANALDQAERSLQTGIEACGAVGLGSGLILGQYYLGRVWLAKGEVAKARRMMAEPRYRPIGEEQASIATTLDRALAARIALWDREPETAAGWLDSVPLESTATAPYGSDEHSLALVQAVLAQGRLETAAGLIETLASRAEAAGRWGTLIPLTLLRAESERRSGRQDRARVALEKSLTLAAPEGYVRPFLEEGAALLHLLPDVRQQAPAFVDRVTRAAGHLRGTAAPGYDLDPLTPRELEVLRLIAQDLNNQAIAERLVVAVSTVKKHVNRIFSKLGARDRTQAVLKARENGLL